MMEWEYYSWGDLVELKYGKSLKGYREKTDGFIVYGTNGPIGFHNQYLYDKPSLIIGRKGAYRGVEYSDKPFYVIDTAYYTIAKVDFLDIKFGYYQLLTKNINALDSGSAIPSTSRDDFYSLEAYLPPLKEQQAIAKTLSLLDDKISLLRQQNETLEQLAQTLCKRWFVDFEFPDAQGQPYKSAGGKMIESELGEIPEGWEVGKLGDVVEIGSSKRIFASEYKTTGIPFYRGKEITKLSNGNIVNCEIFISESRYQDLKTLHGVPKENDILLTSVGTIGNTYLVKNNDPFYFKDGNLTWIKSYKSHIQYDFVFEWLNSNSAAQKIESIKIGSTQQAITIKALNNLTLIIPSHLSYLNLSNSLRLNIKKRQVNQEQIQTLTRLRDTLLPKLMSGELRLGE